MHKLLAWMLIFLSLGLMIVFALGKTYDSLAARNYAEAAKLDAYGRSQAQIIQAQSQARLDAAQASTMTTSTMALVATTLLFTALPWAILGILGLLGFGLVTLLALAIVTHSRLVIGPPVRLIERQVVYLPTPGQSRRQTWQAITEMSNDRVLSLNVPPPSLTSQEDVRKKGEES